MRIFGVLYLFLAEVAQDGRGAGAHDRLVARPQAAVSRRAAGRVRGTRASRISRAVASAVGASRPACPAGRGRGLGGDRPLMRDIAIIGSDRGRTRREALLAGAAAALAATVARAAPASTSEPL